LGLNNNKDKEKYDSALDIQELSGKPNIFKSRSDRAKEKISGNDLKTLLNATKDPQDQTRIKVRTNL